MFRYKICYECKIWFIASLLIYSLVILTLYKMYLDQAPVLSYLMLLVALFPATLFNYLHYRDHQKKQFDKIINKFGVN